ncbi:MAG: hypothetical protein Q8J92_13750 [Parvibaculum sp.]|nr:hypothetical protein [Parvibaculum sp.]
MMDYNVSPDRAWPAEDEQTSERGWTPPSLLVLGLVTLAIVMIGLMTLSVASAPFTDLLPITRASASVAPHAAPTGRTLAQEHQAAFDMPPGYAIAIVSEATLTGLRSYMLTGDNEFRAGWTKTAAQLRGEVSRLRDASSGWSDGKRLRHLVRFEKQVAGMLDEQDVIAALVGSPNRFPGVRLYNEDVAPQLAHAEALCATLLATLLERPTEMNAATIDALARQRAALRRVSEDLTKFIQLGTSVSRSDMAGRVVEMEEIATVLNGELRHLPPADADAARQLHAAVGAMTGPLDKIMALRTAPQWDYAGFVFDEKVLPRYRDVLAELKQLD